MAVMEINKLAAIKLKTGNMRLLSPVITIIRIIDQVTYENGDIGLCRKFLCEWKEKGQMKFIIFDANTLRHKY